MNNNPIRFLIFLVVFTLMSAIIISTMLDEETLDLEMAPRPPKITVQGVVIENVWDDLVADAPAYIKVRVDKNEATKNLEEVIEITYDDRGGALCKNVIKGGYDLKVGDRVEIYGELALSNVIATCPSKEFYIKHLP